MQLGQIDCFKTNEICKHVTSILHATYHIVGSKFFISIYLLNYILLRVVVSVGLIYMHIANTNGMIIPF